MNVVPVTAQWLGYVRTLVRLREDVLAGRESPLLDDLDTGVPLLMAMTDEVVPSLLVEVESLRRIAAAYFTSRHTGTCHTHEPTRIEPECQSCGAKNPYV